MTTPKRRSGVPDPQAAVRVATFERAMAVFNAEIGLKVAASLEQMYRLKVQPLERKIAWLETPFHKKMWLHAKGWWAALRPTVGAAGNPR
jgi:hypothetical protein